MSCGVLIVLRDIFMQYQDSYWISFPLLSNIEDHFYKNRLEDEWPSQRL